MVTEAAVQGCPYTGALSYPFRRDPARPLDPPAEFAMLRRSRPLSKVRLWDGNEVWLVTRYADARAILRDPRLSVAPTAKGFPMISPAVTAIKGGEASFRTMDPPRHTELRRMWLPFFTSRAIGGLRPTVQATVDEILDRMLAGGAPADFIAQFALAIPSHVIGLLLAVPESDHEFFHKRYSTFLTITNTPEQIRQAASELHAFWLRKIDEREADPGEDIVSRIVVNEVIPGRLSKPELAAMCQLMLRAGHETTANMIGLGTLMFLQHPDQLAAIRADRALLPGAVDELMRYLSIAQFGLSRVATADVDVGGEIIREGDGVLIVLPSGNRDEAEYPEADTFDIRRRAQGHLAFGAGDHLCIGSPLAKMEMEVVFETLFRRVPTLRLAVPEQELKYKFDSLFFGLQALPVEW